MQKPGKKIIVPVTNDLVTDQRAHKICLTLQKNGYVPVLLGRKTFSSEFSVSRTYATKRMTLVFRSSWLFYAEYNIRLFLFLIFSNYNLIWSNDLDTLPASALAAKFRNKHLCYDCHEYFVEVPELTHRRLVRNIWVWLEKLFIAVPHSYSTVSDSIAKVYGDKYDIKMKVLKNLPLRNEDNLTSKSENSKDQTNIILYQGSVNVDRGLEEMIETMQYINNAELWIVGDGDIRQQLVALSEQLKLTDQVKIKGRVPFAELNSITKQATIGISLEKPIGMNYQYAMPNKLFDYLQAGIPVVVSALPEMKKFVKEYQIGLVAENHEISYLADLMNSLLKDKSRLKDFRNQCLAIREQFTWENQEAELLSMLEN